MKRVIIVHQWSGRPDKDFMPWLRKSLTGMNFEVVAPQMPDPDNPQIKPWLDKLKEVLTYIKKDDLMIGHSIGCQTILRFLEIMSQGLKINRVIMVAPWVSLKGLDEESQEIAKPWIETPIDFEKVKSKSDSYVSFFSKDDTYVSLESNSKFFRNKLNSEIITFENKGHFTQEDGITELPEILDYI